MTTERGAVVALAVAFALPGCRAAPASDGNGDVYDAWRAQRSRVEVTASGSVARYLGVRSGRSGAHEGFLLHLRGAAGRGLTVRVETNVDITGIVPLSEGEDVVVRGEYVYDARGGIVHYTHRDPRGRHPGGWVQAGGKLYD